MYTLPLISIHCTYDTHTHTHTHTRARARTQFEIHTLKYTLKIHKTLNPLSHQTSARRGMMAGIGGVAAAGVLSQFKGAQAAYGDPANVFGKTTNPKGFIPTKRDDYSFLLPSKWLYSSERDFDGITERYQDNFDAVNFAAIIKKDASGKNSIDQLGSPEDFLKSQTYLFGQQAWTGETKSEGGFKPGAVAAVSLLDYGTKTDKKGTKYYEYELLSRTADGDEGGRHKLITAGVKNGQLYVLYIQVGDKRWFKGVDKEALGLRDSFTLA